MQTRMGLLTAALGIQGGLFIDAALNVSGWRLAVAGILGAIGGIGSMICAAWVDTEITKSVKRVQ